MKNKNMTVKERNLLKGAIRRVFSRSELRRRVIATAAISHTDAERPRVRKWSLCPVCLNKTPTYLMQADHLDPIVPVDKALEDMTWDTVVDRTWCEENNLQPTCKTCHASKTKAENKVRRMKRKERKANE